MSTGSTRLLGTYLRPRARILFCWAVRVLDDRLVMYLFSSKALSALLLMDFKNLFLLFDMKFTQILYLVSLSVLRLELVLFGAAFFGACPLTGNVGSPVAGTVGVGHHCFLGTTAVGAAIPGNHPDRTTMGVAGTGRWWPVHAAVVAAGRQGREWDIQCSGDQTVLSAGQ